MGGITQAAPDAALPPDSDLDLMLVVDRPTTTTDPIDDFYRGVAIEAGIRGMEDYASAEKVLANPEIADHIAIGAIVADPIGLLAAVQPVVAREFAQRQWVTLRCEDEKGRFEMYAAAARLATVPAEFMIHAMLAVQSLASLVAVALLVPPTHRKALVLLREQLRVLGRPGLFERALVVSGVHEMSKERVQGYLDHAGVAFDRALEVKRTPAPFDFKLRPHLRPYLIDGSQAMINAGDHREAMPWIGATIFVATAVLLNDAPADERPRSAALLQEMVSDLGLVESPAREERLELITELAGAMSALAEDIVASRPDQLVTA